MSARIGWHRKADDRKRRRDTCAARRVALAPSKAFESRRSRRVSSSSARESTLPRQRIWSHGAGRNSPASANADDPERPRGCYQARVATTWLPSLILAPLIAFGLYRRFKRSFGRQKLVMHRMVLRMVVLSVVSALFLCWLPTAAGFAAAAAGLVVGVSLAFIDLSHTEVVRTDAGSFFTPNRWIGLVVTSLFVARLTVRLFAVYQHSAEVGQGVPSPPSLQRSPPHPWPSTSCLQRTTSVTTRAC